MTLLRTFLVFSCLCFLASAGAVENISFEKVAGPAIGGSVLDLGEPGSFDSEWVSCPSVIFDGRQFRMWYSSLYDSKRGPRGIGLALSSDGVNWTRVNQGEAVLEVGSEGALDDGQVMGPEVLHDGDIYRMWYTGMAREWHNSGFGFYRIFLATSQDGIRWQRVNGGRPVLDIGPAGSYDAVQAATPSILKEDGIYRMWYAAWTPERNHTICVARSRDGIHWERENEGKPVTGLFPSGAYAPAVTQIGNQYLMMYMALHAKPGLYGATSKDGIYWTMLNRGSPILLPGVDGAFDSSRVGDAFLLPIEGTLWAWYTGYRRLQDGVYGLELKIGLARGILPTD